VNTRIASVNSEIGIVTKPIAIVNTSARVTPTG